MAVEIFRDLVSAEAHRFEPVTVAELASAAGEGAPGENHVARQRAGPGSETRGSGQAQCIQRRWRTRNWRRRRMPCFALRWMVPRCIRRCRQPCHLGRHARGRLTAFDRRAAAGAAHASCRNSWTVLVYPKSACPAAGRYSIRACGMLASTRLRVSAESIIASRPPTTSNSDRVMRLSAASSKRVTLARLWRKWRQISDRNSAAARAPPTRRAEGEQWQNTQHQLEHRHSFSADTSRAKQNEALDAIGAADREISRYPSSKGHSNKRVSSWAQCVAYVMQPTRVGF